MRPIASAALVSSALVVGACAAPRPPVDIGPFDAQLAARMLSPGSNTIRGSAFLRQAGGGVVTCAGREVSLVPATPYARRLYAALYGTEHGAAEVQNGPRLTGQNPGFAAHIRTTQCDAQGTFTFDRVADGDFFLETTVTWVVDGFTEGGPIMRRVPVSGGQSISVVIAP
jgi:hypothetical protein